MCESKEGGEIYNATPRGTATGAISRNYNEDRKFRATRRARVETRTRTEAMYLPAFSRVGARFSRGASRPTRVVFVDQLRAQKESALRTQPQRGSAGVHVMLSNAGTTSARGLPGGPARGKRCFCENILDTGEASRAYPLYYRFSQMDRAEARKSNKLHGRT